MNKKVVVREKTENGWQNRIRRMECIGISRSMLPARYMAEPPSLSNLSQLRLCEQFDYRLGKTLSDSSRDELNLGRCLLPVANDEGNVKLVFSVRRSLPHW